MENTGITGVGAIYCINLRGATDRMRYVDMASRTHNINITRVEAVEAKDVDMKDYKHRPTELACLMSHLKALKEFLDNGKGIAMILEDDFELRVDFRETLEKVFKEWDKEKNGLLLLSPYIMSWDGVKHIGSSGLYNVTTGPMGVWGAIGYIITRDVAEKCIQKAIGSFDRTETIITQHEGAVFIYDPLVIEASFSSSIIPGREQRTKEYFDNFRRRNKYTRQMMADILLLNRLPSTNNGAPTVITVAILAKDKAHCLPRFLKCLETQTWPKEKTHLYIRTNNNNDKTADVLEEWIKTSSYAKGCSSVFFDKSDVEEKVENYKPHEWNEIRFKVLGKIRQDSIRYAVENKSHYMVIDCDNFITEDVLERMFSSGLSVVAPMLRTDRTMYSNYHSSIDADGYFIRDEVYDHILRRKIKGLIDVPVVHCTYFIRNEVLDKVKYQDDTKRHEYVIFSETMRKAGISQYLDNRKHYGYITMADTLDELRKESWFMDNDTVWDVIYQENKWDNGSGPGSLPEKTIEYRNMLESFMKEHKIKTVLDIGCGDWQFSKLIDWGDVKYTGIDCVKDMIDKNKELYKQDGREFILMNVIKEPDKLREYKVDLIIMKDVLQHWPVNEIYKIIGIVRKCTKYILITNCCNQGDEGDDINFGGFRPLSHKKKPLKLLDVKLLMQYGMKEVVLINGN